MNRLRTVIAFLLAVAAVFCWRVGDGWLASLERVGNGTTLRCGKPLSAFDYGAMERVEQRTGEPAPFVLWTELTRQEIVSAGMERTAQASVVLAHGDVRLLFPAALAVGDTGGALVDRATARTLFGSGEVKGARIRCLGKDREIRGVLDVPQPTVVLQVDAKDKTPLENITIPDAREKEPFALRHGLEIRLTVENSVWRRLAGFFGALPILLCAVWAGASLTAAAYRSREYPARSMVSWMGLMILSTACALWLLSSLPLQWVPPRWSNFGFWKEVLHIAKNAFWELLAAQKYRPDLLLLAKAGRVAGMGLLSFCCLLAAKAAGRGLFRKNL